MQIVCLGGIQRRFVLAIRPLISLEVSPRTVHAAPVLCTRHLGDDLLVRLLALLVHLIHPLRYIALSVDESPAYLMYRLCVMLILAFRL